MLIEEWTKKKPYNYELVEESDLMLTGFHLSKRKRSKRNCFQCGQGRSNRLMAKWNLVDSALCGTNDEPSCRVVYGTFFLRRHERSPLSRRESSPMVV